MAPQSSMDTRAIVEAMAAAINSGRGEAVAKAMTPDGVFIDSLGRRIEGRAALTVAWRSFCRLVPDYRIEIEAMMVEELDALAHGWAGGTVHRDSLPVGGGAWRVPAAWRATTDGARRIALWQVFADTSPLAERLKA